MQGAWSTFSDRYSGGTVAYTHDSLDRLTATTMPRRGGSAYAYDRLGNARVKQAKSRDSPVRRPSRTSTIWPGA